MWSLLYAEWLKTIGNRWVTAFMIWIFPVGALAYMLITGVLLVLVPSMRLEQNLDAMGLLHVRWTDQAINVWSFPNGLVGRLVVLGFTSVVFAGEYQWRTWKSIVPRHQRSALVLVKFVTVALFIVLAFSLMSVIFGVGTVLLSELVGTTHGPRITGAVLRAFAGDYAAQVALTLTLTVISASVAALAGMLMRSILGGVITGVLATYTEGLSIVFLLLAAHLFDDNRIVHLYRLTPSYNVANVQSWLVSNTPEGDTAALLDGVAQFSDSLTFSVVLLGAWVVGLVGVTVVLFQHQDIT